MTLSELRKKHPGIKATSVKVFMQKLEELAMDKLTEDTHNEIINPKETIIQAEDVFEPSVKINPINQELEGTVKDISEGLGDTIEKITKATGIKKVVEWIAGKDCGCAERKNKLNELYRYKVECMVESEYIWWTEFLKRQSPKIVEKEDVFEISRLFTRLFKQRAEICINCPSGFKRVQKIIEHINKVYESYNN